MEQRKYDFYDVKQFLKDQYNIDWKGFRIFDIDKIRKVRLSDIKGENNYLRIVVPVNENEAEDMIFVEVTNNSFRVVSNNINNNKSKLWKELINSKEHTPKY
jgi:hypothetical protein